MPPEARDITAFDGHVVRSRDALARERLPLARAEIDTALGLWRGPALGEAAEEPFALREGTRLNAARQDAGELLAAILIAQGDLVPAVSVAEQLTVGTPLREVSWSLLMRALYAAGRPVEALRQYDRFRTTLARELGLGPSLPPPQRARPVARVPDAVRRIVQARLARLPAPARTMLTYAMADGGRLDMGLLADVQCLTHEQLLRPVEDSVVGRLVARHEDPDALGGGHHRLSDLVHDVLLRALTTSSRQLLHSAIARALTGRGDADPGRPDDQLRAADPMAPAAAFGQSGRSLLDPEP
ncbi:ATPase-like protein [Streptomyces sp. KO7888]|nr:ATPase-like protein [Streptomyces sp. KO7888]